MLNCRRVTHITDIGTVTGVKPTPLNANASPEKVKFVKPFRSGGLELGL